MAKIRDNKTIVITAVVDFIVYGEEDVNFMKRIKIDHIGAVFKDIRNNVTYCIGI